MQTKADMEYELEVLFRRWQTQQELREGIEDWVKTEYPPEVSAEFLRKTMAEAPEADALLDAVMRPKVKAAVAPAAERPRSPRETAEEEREKAAVKPEPKPPAQPAEPPPEEPEPLPLAAESAGLEQKVNEPEVEGPAEDEAAGAQPAVEAEPSPAWGEAAEPELGPAILDPSTPFSNAKVFAKRCCRQGKEQVVWFAEKEFWRWNGKNYEPEFAAKMRGRVYNFLESAKKTVKGQTVPFDPGPRHVNDLLDGLQSGLALSAITPAWLPDGKPATDCTAFANGIVNVKTGVCWPATSKFWSHGALDFDWNPEAEAPRWKEFLMEIFPLDPMVAPGEDNFDIESAEFVEEFLGYCMTDDVDLQKAAMFIGLERCGKGTINRVARQLVGLSAHVGLDINTWLRGEKALQVLLGKRVGTFADVVLKPGKQFGSNYDPGGLPHESIGWLLSLTGEDPVTIPRLYETAWQGILPIKLTLSANMPLNLNHRVLPSRFINLHFPNSFLGKEDTLLGKKLAAELSGIAARAAAAYRKTRKRGGFIQPATGLALMQDVSAKSDTFTRLAQECFVADPEGFITKDVAFNRLTGWCTENGHGTLRKEIYSKAKLFDRLRELSAYKGIFEHQPHGCARGWKGIRLVKRER
jgi:putative DNA primase/helicase